MNIIKRRKIWYLISLILIIPGVVGLFLWKIPMGLDFKGGTLIDVVYNQPVNKEKIAEVLKNAAFENANIQQTGDNGFIIRTDQLNQEQQKNMTDALAKAGEYKQNRLETVGPTVSNDLKRRAIISVIIASLAIIFYIAIAFQKLPKPASSWRFGVCAVIALMHDILFVLGVFAILGHFFNYEIDSLFITALLTIMGFSVHDTIVVFDRIRENLRKSPSTSFEDNVNNSILQTLNRSLNTSFIVIIVLLSLFLLGGQSLRHFTLALLIGIAIGTYSSIFNASPLLVSWHGWSTNRLAKKVAS